ncbi:heavy-metal-associated domain-containing protein [Marinoscillum sp.]|uniref:heavy-metal-associated domain-containing protein n=1 Tax=Marinoscillum sp. TaxID=2024838 RepID=UPI003BAD3099
MKTKIITSLSLFLLSLAVLAQKEPVKVDKGYKVEIKTSAVCEMCKEAIESDLVFEKGVKEVNLDVDSKILTVVYNEKKTDPLTIRKRVAKVGYNADNVKRDPESYENLPMCCKDGAHDDDGNH